MSVLTLYAGSTLPFGTGANIGDNQLPSPTSLKVSIEQIWSENTGRAQSGSNKAEMIGDSIAGKRTFAIEWGILDFTDFSKITQLLPRGFFYFGISDPDTPPSTPPKYYRSEIQYDMIQVGDTRYYKGVSVQVIEK